jgi:hypothetical protein
MRITPLVVLTWIFGSAQSQWVPETYTIPDQMLAISPDGTKAIGSAGIYTQTSGSWTLLQPLSFQYNVEDPAFLRSPNSYSVKFLRSDGSIFAASNYSATLGSYINIFETSSLGSWTISSTIYATTLGYDVNNVHFLPSAATADGNTLIVTYYIDMYVLKNNGTNFVFQQKLETPIRSIYDVSVSADGSNLAVFYSEYLLIFSRKSSGFYEVTDEHSGFQWTQMALSSNGQIMIFSSTTVSESHIFQELMDGTYF